MPGLAAYGLFVAALVIVFPTSAGLLGGISGGLGATAGSLYRDRSYLRLPDDRRARVRRVMRSGTPSGDAELDDVALRKLRESVKTLRSDRVLMSSLAASLVAFIVYVALRTGLWALAVVPMTALLSLRAWRRWRDDPRPRLATLEAQQTRSSPA